MAIAHDTFDDLLSITPDDFKDAARALRALIQSVHPETVEVVRMGDRAATYGIGPKKMKEGYVYIMPHKNWVNLGFYQGASLPDPNGLLEGTGKSLRHIKIKSLEDLQQQGVSALIEAAVELRRR